MAEELSMDDLGALAVLPGLPQAFIRRELTEDDLEVLRQARPQPAQITSSAVIRLKTMHHNIARLLAEGHTNVEVSALTGATPARVTTLSNDPAMQELIHHYRSELQVLYVDVHARLAALGTMALDELAQRMEEDPTQFKHREILEIMQATLDRSVAPVKGKGGEAHSSAPAVAIQVQFVSPTRDSSPPTIDITPSE